MTRQLTLIGESSVARDSADYTSNLAPQPRNYFPKNMVERSGKYTPPSVHRPTSDMLVLYQPDDPTVGFKSMSSIKNPNRAFIVLNPWLHPSDIFIPHVNNYRAARYVNVLNPQQVLVYVAGSCIDYGHPSARAAWSLIFRPEAPEANVTCRLEQDGPQTQHRAELRGAIAALQYRQWHTEGFRSFVIATNSDYVVRGATEFAWKWEKNGWKNPQDGYPVANRALWEKLMKEVRKLESIGVEPKFWHISSEWNEAACEMAEAGTQLQDVDTSFQKVVGVLV